MSWHGFDMVCHGSQAISICADKLTFLFENSIAMKFVSCQLRNLRDLVLYPLCYHTSYRDV